MRSASFVFLLTLGSAVFITPATAMPISRDAGIAPSSTLLQVRQHRGRRAYHRAPQRVMGLTPGPDRRRGRPFRLPR